MPHIICLETTSDICSVALIKQGQMVDSIENTEKNVHAQFLTSYIDQLLSQHQISYPQLHAIAISSGPGSYTGLRIATSVAKGLCYALNIPLIAINTLRALAQAAQQQHPNAEYYIPMIDARRMEVYTAVFDQQLAFILPPQAMILPNDALTPYLHQQQSVLCGNGASKIKFGQACSATVLTNDMLNFSAKHLYQLSLQSYQQNNFADIAYFEPFYLKNNY